MTKDIAKGMRKEENIWVKAEKTKDPNSEKSPLQSFLESNNAFTLPDILQFSAKKYGNSNCLGTRKLLERRKIDNGGKVLEKLVLGDYTWMSYNEVDDLVMKVSKSLSSLGFEKNHRVVIFAETRAEWFISAIGCLKQGMTIVTLYTTLCDEGLCHGIEETEVDTIFTSFELLPRLLKILPKCNTVKNVVVFEDQLEGFGNVPVETTWNIYSFQEFLKLGKQVELTKCQIDLNDEAIIMYTSGTTGKPKGVIVSHENIYYALLSYDMQTSFTAKERYLAYLPLAHAFELFSEVALISVGVTIAYSSPLTMTNNSPKVSKGTLGDAKILKPTIISVVPLILERIIKSVTQKVENDGKMKVKMFKTALQHKQKHGSSFFSRLLDMIIFDKVKAELGGAVSVMVVGSAPVSNEATSMIRAMFGCSVRIGFGCTETVACATCTDSDDLRLGHVGAPNPFIQIKLIDWEEGDFLTTDKPRPRGEIVVGGKCVTLGYFKLPKETEESFYEENGVRWFRTGDIGEFDETGVLYIIDRKKDLAKLKHGEYVSLGFIESRLKTCPLIDNICMFADPNENHTVAVIIPTNHCLRKIASEHSISSEETFENLCSNPKVISSFLGKLKSFGQRCSLTKWDIPQAIHLTSSQWTPDAGLVTAALKLKRKAIQVEYDEQIKGMYNK